MVLGALPELVELTEGETIMRVQLTVLLAIIGCGAVGAAPASAQASSEAARPIHACYVPGAGVLYVVEEGASGACRRQNDVLVTWNGFVDLALLQQRVAAGCGAAARVRAIHADGSVDCEVDDDAAATVDFGSFQARLEGGCVAGYLLRAVAADGTLECVADARPELTGLQVRIAYACPEGSSIRAIDEMGNVDCHIDDFRGFMAGPSASVSRADRSGWSTVDFGSGISRQACFLTEVEMEDIDWSGRDDDGWESEESAGCTVSGGQRGWSLSAILSGNEDDIDANVWCSASCVSW